MKKPLLFITFIFISQNIFASPLVYKSTKIVTTFEQIELGLIDTSKYKQVRIAIIAKNRETQVPASKSIAEIELNSAKREFDRKKGLLEMGIISKADFDETKDRLDIAQRRYDAAVEKVFSNISIYGIESNDNILINAFDDNLNNRSFLIDTPPSKLSIKVFGKGTYSLYVWASI